MRRYWEDEITRQFLRPHLHKLIERCRQSMRRLRIMDLGCGSADGYELLMGVRHRDADLEEVEIDLITSETLGRYKGVDLSADLLEQARGIYGDNPKIVFEQTDFTKGLPVAKDEKPYDLYFSSFGTTCGSTSGASARVKVLTKSRASTPVQTTGLSVWGIRLAR